MKWIQQTGSGSDENRICTTSPRVNSSPIIFKNILWLYDFDEITEKLIFQGIFHYVINWFPLTYFSILWQIIFFCKPNLMTQAPKCYISLVFLTCMIGWVLSSNDLLNNSPGKKYSSRFDSLSLCSNFCEALMNIFQMFHRLCCCVCIWAGVW